MASKIKVDQIQTADGTGTIALQNQLSGLASASMPTGSVLQVVQTTTNTTVVVSADSFTSVGNSATITPRDVNSKILVMNTAGVMAYNANSVSFRILRNGSQIHMQSRTGYTNSNDWTGMPVKLMYLDDINTASAVTYTFECRVQGNNIEYNSDRGGGVSNDNSAVTILMEIAG